MKSLHVNIEQYRKIALKQPSGFTQGIYFNLDADAYHADPAFSHSGMVDILKHPHFYWVKSPLNPNREEKKQTEAMFLGDLIHQRLLTPELFYKKYRRATDGYDREKQILAGHIYDKVEEAVETLGETKEIYFSDGYPEVSIFWICPLTNLRLKARFDWLRPYGAVDRKNTREIIGNEIGQAICEYGYDIQEAHYVEGGRIIKKLLKEGGNCVVKGNVDPEWLKRFIEEPAFAFAFLFQRAQWPFVYECLTLPDDVIANAYRCIEEAKWCYLDNLELHGTKFWPAGSHKLRELPSTDIPLRIYNRGYNGRRA